MHKKPTGSDRKCPKWPLFKKRSFWTLQVTSDWLFSHQQVISSPLYYIIEAQGRRICQIPKNLIKKNFFDKFFWNFFFFLKNFFENFFLKFFLNVPFSPDLSSFLVYTGCGSGIRCYKFHFRTLYIPKKIVSGVFRMKYWWSIFQKSTKHDQTKVQN